MTQDNREKSERTIQDVLKEINGNLELIIKTQKEMTQTLDDYIERKEKMIEEYKKSIKCGLEEYWKRMRIWNEKSSHLKDTILYNFFKNSEKISIKTPQTTKTQYIVQIRNTIRKSQADKWLFLRKTFALIIKIFNE